MPPGRKPSFSREQFVEAAIRYADENGLEALRLRELGAELGVSGSAVYRYFPSKDDLIVAIREELLSQGFGAVPASSDPREVLIVSALAYRRTAREHPCLSQIMSLRVTSGDRAIAVPTVVAGALRDLGLRGQAVAVAYRQLESFIVGASSFDFSNAPHHLEERLDRLQRSGDEDVAAGLVTTNDVDEMNELAFERTLLVLVDALVAQGALRE